jgi:glycine hydroxymethyltransferase
MCTQQDAEKIDKAVMPGIQGGPCMHIIAAKAVAFYEASLPTFQIYQKQVIINARHMAQTLQNLGYKIVAGGTDNHMVMVDLRPKQMTGRSAEQMLEKAGLTVNRVCVPYDPEKPRITSGIRIGTAAITTRNMKEQEVEQIAQYINEVLTREQNEHKLEQIRAEVALFCKRFPLP